jgi:hypothetical protein
MTFSPSSAPSAAAAARAELSRRARWARDAAALDREFGPVTSPVLPMQDGESVADWRKRQQAAIREHLGVR